MGAAAIFSRLIDTDAGLLRLARAKPMPLWKNVLAGIGWAFAGLLVRAAASAFYGDITGFTILLPGVVLAALSAGRVAGLVSVAACLGGGWLLLHLTGSGHGMDPTLSRVATVNFVIVGVFTVVVAASLRKTLARLEAAQGDARTAAAALRRSDTQLEAMIDQASAGIARVGLDGKVVSANQRFADILGRSAADVIGVTTGSASHPDDVEPTLALLRSVLDGGPAGQIEKRYIRPDGGVVWGLTSLSALTDENGQPAGYIAVVVDITDAKTAEAALRESEERFRLMADTAPSPVWLTNEDGEVEFVNAALVKFYGKAADDIMGHVWKMAMHPDDLAGVSAIQSVHRPRHEAYGFEARFERHDGAWRWMQVSVNPRFDGEGLFRGYVGLSFDVTESHEALDALARQDSRQSFLLALTDQLRDLDDPRAVMDAVNRAVGEYLGVARAGFGELDRDAGVFRLYRDWTNGVPTSEGDWPIEDFGGEIDRDLAEGLPLIIEDVATDPRTAAVLEVHRGISVQAFVTIPLMRAGRLRAFMHIHSATPRVWSAEEIGLIDETAERAWIEVERTRAQAEVAESEARFRAIADTAPVLIWVTQQDRQRAFVNQAYVAFMGGDYESVRTADWRTYIHPDDQERLVQDSLAGEATREPFALEARYKNHAGEYRWLKSFSRPRLSPTGEVLGFVGVAFDVTDIRETNARLVAAAAERDAILGQLAEGVIVTDPAGAIVFVNDAAARHHGVASLDITPDEYAETYHLLTDDGRPYPPLELPLSRAVLRGETVTDARWRIRRPDGSEVIAVGNARPVSAPDGSRIGAVLTLRDETARIDAEDRLTESEARFRTVADSAPALIWMTDETASVTFANRRYQTFFGVETEAVLGQGWRNYVQPADLATFSIAFLRALKRRSRFEAMMRVDHPTMGVRWLRSEGVPRFDAAGVFQGYVGASLDITDAKRAEDDLKRINELLEDRVSAALAEKAQAEADLMHAQRMEAVGRLTGGVAHDFNNLLTVVIGALDMILRSPDDAARRQKLGEAALAAARRGEGLTHQLLAFSRRQALRPEPIDLNALIRESEPLLRRAVGEAVSFKTRLKRGGVRVSVDPSQFEAALLNLIVNARDAVADGQTTGGGSIVIETMSCEIETGDVSELPAGTYVCVTVTDNGSGMDAITMARVFEPFFTTKSVGKGTGLGLSQVYGFARQSGGGVRIHSTVGEGTEMRLYLPPLAADAGLNAAAVSPEPDAIPSGRRLLLVEDDESVAVVAMELLAGMGLDVEAAETGPEALQALARSRFDVMLSDVVMPGGMTGIELARLCAVDHPDLRILLTSGYAGDDVDEALSDAPWPFLRKPYSADQLRRALGELLPLDE